MAIPVNVHNDMVLAGRNIHPRTRQVTGQHLQIMPGAEPGLALARRIVSTTEADIKRVEISSLPLDGIGARLSGSIPPGSPGCQRIGTLTISDPFPHIGTHIVKTVHAGLRRADGHMGAAVVVHAIRLIARRINVGATLDVTVCRLRALFGVGGAAPLADAGQTASDMCAVVGRFLPADMNGGLVVSPCPSLRLLKSPASTPCPARGEFKPAALALRCRPQTCGMRKAAELADAHFGAINGKHTDRHAL